MNLTKNYVHVVAVAGFVARTANAPPIMPNMKPIMNPPPVITLGIENTTIIIPHTFLFTGLLRNIMAPSNTRTPHIRPTAVRLANGTVELSADPGSVGITQGNQVAATPKSAELPNIRIPAVRDKRKALAGISLRLIDSHIILSFPGHFIQLKTYK